MKIPGNFKLQQLEFSPNCVCNLRIFEYVKNSILGNESKCVYKANWSKDSETT